MASNKAKRITRGAGSHTRQHAEKPRELIQRSRKSIPNGRRDASKNNPCASNRTKRVKVPENFHCERDSGFRWHIPQKDEEPKRFLPLDERKISFINSDIKDDASLVQVVTPPNVGIA
jgi:hypothetical protein